MFSSLRHIVWLPQTLSSVANQQDMSQTIQSAAIFTAVANDRAAGQQIVNLPQICRDLSQYVAMFSRLRHIS
jgi:hypothetical protein